MKIPSRQHAMDNWIPNYPFSEPEEPMEFVPTSKCRVFPDTWRGIRPELALSHMSDEEIDQCLQILLRYGVTVNDIPRSQYGRRVTVDTYFKLERGQPITYGVSVPTPYKPGQPR